RTITTYQILTKLPATTNTSAPSLHDALPIYGRPGQRHIHQPDDRSRWLVRVPRTATRDVQNHGDAAGRLPGRQGHDRHPGGLHRSEEHTSELQSRVDLVCRLLLEKKKLSAPL